MSSIISYGGVVVSTVVPWSAGYLAGIEINGRRDAHPTGIGITPATEDPTLESKPKIFQVLANFAETGATWLHYYNLNAGWKAGACISQAGCRMSLFFKQRHAAGGGGLGRV
jgi:hypothetical protein